MNSVTHRSPDACVTDPWIHPSARRSDAGQIDSDFERERRERRRSLEDLRKLDEDLRREQARDRFYRIRHGYR